MFGDMGYGSNGHAIATRAHLDRVYDEYDFIYLVGVRSRHVEPVTLLPRQARPVNTPTRSFMAVALWW